MFNCEALAGRWWGETAKSWRLRNGTADRKSPGGFPGAFDCTKSHFRLPDRESLPGPGCGCTLFPLLVRTDADGKSCRVGHRISHSWRCRIIARYCVQYVATGVWRQVKL